MLKTSISVLGVKHIIALLQAKEAKAANLRPAWEEVDDVVTEFFEKQFQTRGQHGGTKWAPLTTTTVMFKQKFGPAKGGATTILEDTQELMRSLTVRGASHSYRKAGADSYERGTTRKGAIMHQEGFKSTSIFGKPRTRAVNVPARKLVPDQLPSPFLAEVEKILTKYIMA